MTDKHEYRFIYDEITCCSNCPMFYDYIYCELDGEERDFESYTWTDDNIRPGFCKLYEKGLTCHDTWDTIFTGRLRFECSECGAVSLEITPNYCPNCGARVVNDD